MKFFPTAIAYLLVVGTEANKNLRDTLVSES